MRFELDVNRRNVDSTVLLSDLKLVASRLGKTTVTISEYDRQGVYSSGALRQRFGGWAEALREAGLAVEHHNAGVPVGEAIADLKKVAENLKKQTVTQGEYSKHGRFSPRPLVRHFGSWLRALEAAGLNPSRSYDIPDEDLFKNIETIWRTLGRQPRYSEVVKPLSAFSHGTYEQRFGSWRKALEAFVSFINSSPNAQAPPPEPEQPSEPDRPSAHTARRRTPRAISWRLRFLVLRRDNFRCRICGCSPALKPAIVLVVDHVSPWAEGGETEIENLQTLCEPCNGGKSDLPMTNG
jgi:hypothetical protein